jgi:hypothetical protein
MRNFNPVPPKLIYAMTPQRAQAAACDHGIKDGSWKYVSSYEDIMAVERGSVMWLVGDYMQCSDAPQIMLTSIGHDMQVVIIP